MITTTLIAATLGAVIYDQADLLERRPEFAPQLSVNLQLQADITRGHGSAVVRSEDATVTGTTTLDGSTVHHSGYSIAGRIEGENTSQPIGVYDPDAIDFNDFTLSIEVAADYEYRWQNEVTHTLTPVGTSLRSWTADEQHIDWTGSDIPIRWTIQGPETTLHGDAVIPWDDGYHHTYYSAYSEWHPLNRGVGSRYGRAVVFDGSLDGSTFRVLAGASGSFVIIPEPAAAMLLLLGVVSLAACLRR